MALLPIVFTSPLKKRESESDSMCTITPSVLCVKDALKTIAKVAENINGTIHDIEQHIISNSPTRTTLQNKTRSEMNSIHSWLPTSRYHDQFFNKSNIDKKYLVELLSEALYAMSFYYNSIEDIINMKEIFAYTTDLWFKEIQYNLRLGIICQYRSVLNVYSHEWPSINDIKSIQFWARKRRDAPSLVHNVHSVLIAKLLRGWMERIHGVIRNLEGKLL